MRIQEACDGSRSTRILDPHWENIWSRAENVRRICRINPERIRLPASDDPGGEGTPETCWPGYPSTPGRGARPTCGTSGGNRPFTYSWGLSARGARDAHETARHGLSDPSARGPGPGSPELLGRTVRSGSDACATAPPWRRPRDRQSRESCGPDSHTAPVHSPFERYRRAVLDALVRLTPGRPRTPDWGLG